LFLSHLAQHTQFFSFFLGYSAVVPRASEVEINALDEKGNKVNWIVKGWTARIVQHEMDHLSGNNEEKSPYLIQEKSNCSI